MSPFRRVSTDPILTQLQRDAFLTKPCEFFAPLFGGRVPSLVEKLHWIEEALLRMQCAHVFENNLYHVELHLMPPFIQLDIRRHDEQSCTEWRHMQQIKNELVGPEYEAVELFPAESRLVDTANQYHLWVHADPAFRFPFGFEQRFVLEEPLRI